MPETYLSSEPARSLTSRELARLLGGVLGVLCVAPGADVVTIQAATSGAYQIMTSDDVAKTYEEMAGESADVLRLAIFIQSIARGWEGLGDPGAMVAALRFYAERTDVWASMGATAVAVQPSYGEPS